MPGDAARLYILTALAMRRNHHYHDRVNGVPDYIGEHLDGDLSLTRLSGVAGFSQYHFHRIFQGITGETFAWFSDIDGNIIGLLEPAR